MTFPTQSPSSQFDTARTRTSYGRPTRARLDQLIRVLEEHAEIPELLAFAPELEEGATGRAFHLLEETDEHQAWLISWRRGVARGALARGVRRAAQGRHRARVHR
jgi:hypothetical protein